MLAAIPQGENLTNKKKQITLKITELLRDRYISPFLLFFDFFGVKNSSFKLRAFVESKKIKNNAKIFEDNETKITQYLERQKKDGVILLR